MPADALRIRGRHNALNALAALALATAIGCPLAPMLHALREYSGEPHRVEYVATVAGVDAFDDSKGTNVGATVAALVGLGSERAPAKLVVILGGDGKGQDFAPLVAPLRRACARGGHHRPRRRGDRARVAAPACRSSAARRSRRRCAAAFARAQPGDAVLLSPACASLDMFRNYAHRAEVFVAAVQALADVPTAGERRMSARSPASGSRGASGSRRRRHRRARSAPQAAAAAAARQRPPPRRSRCANGSASTAASRRACSASTARSSASSSPCSRSAW